MREIKTSQVVEAVKKMCMSANYNLDGGTRHALQEALRREESPAGAEVLRQLIENAELAEREKVPLCQDTGLAVVFADVGQEVHMVGGSLEEAINEGVRQGYGEGYLRKSVLCDPLRRVNTGDNTPAVIHYRVVPGDKLRLLLFAKGGGAENMSRVLMLSPSEGREGVKRAVVQRISESGANPCPPVIVGVGLGGTFEKAAELAKLALAREVGKPHPDPEIARLEKELLEEINNLGIGPMGMGGRTTCLGVQVELFPCHIASLPLAINVQCHSQRHEEVIL
ncbi:MAG: fumarate hydratase [Nitrospinota bacterium]